MAGHGSWTRWKRAPAMASPGFAFTIPSSTAPVRYPRVLGPADSTHGISRPFRCRRRSESEPDGPAVQKAPRRVAWHSPTKPAGDRPPGSASEAGTLLDVRGEIGRVSMSVVLVPFPKPAAAAS